MTCSSALTFPIGLSPGILRTGVGGGEEKGTDVSNVTSIAITAPLLGCHQFSGGPNYKLARRCTVFLQRIQEEAFP